MSASNPIRLQRPWKLALMVCAAGMVSIALSDVFTRLTFESLSTTRHISTSRSSNEKVVVKPLSLSSLLPDSWVDGLETAERWFFWLSGGALALYGVWLVALPKRMAPCPACGESQLIQDEVDFDCPDCKATLRVDGEVLRTNPPAAS